MLVGIGVLAAAPGTVWYFLVRGIARPATGSAPAAEKPTPSIAVLPFVNLSSDKEQEYFSDGIAEEILNALAQVEGLRVAGRTSSFYFKGRNEDLASIAAKLHVSTLLEGSVRKAGGQVRITAQFINAADGYHLWSKQYDRSLPGSGLRTRVEASSSTLPGTRSSRGLVTRSPRRSGPSRSIQSMREATPHADGSWHTFSGTGQARKMTLSARWRSARGPKSS